MAFWGMVDVSWEGICLATQIHRAGLAARDRMAVGIPEGYFCMRYFFGTVPEMVRSIAIGAFVCLSAGVYLKNHTRPDFTNFSVCAICGRGSVLHCCALPVL